MFFNHQLRPGHDIPADLLLVDHFFFLQKRPSQPGVVHTVDHLGNVFDADAPEVRLAQIVRLIGDNTHDLVGLQEVIYQFSLQQAG